MRWVARAVGDEDAVEVVRDFVDGEVVREDSRGGTAGGERAEDVLLDAAVNHGDVQITTGGHMAGRLCRDTLHQVDLLRVDEGFVLISIVFLANGDAG